MDSVFKSFSPLTLRFHDGSEIEVPSEFLRLFSIYFSFRLTAYALGALKRLALNLEDL